MSENLIVEKSKAFALRIVDAYKILQEKKELVMSKQMLRSGTSIGANVAEGQYAQSKADFLSKYTIALKEASETRYWLDLLTSSNYLPDTDATRSLHADVNELLRILTSATRKLKET
jgi:four helix bundle protein